MEPKLIAVYGTLRKGYYNHYLLEDSQFVRGDIVAGYDMHALARFPAVLKGSHTVGVEIYRVESEEVLRRLDWLEGHPTFYRREPVKTEGTESEEGLHCEMYICQDEGVRNFRLVESGVWGG